MATATTSATEITRAAQEQVLEGIRQSQTAFVKAVETWATTVQKTVPATAGLPLPEGLPTPEEVLDGAFDFAEKLLQAQRQFAQDVLKAASPALPRQGEPAL